MISKLKARRRMTKSSPRRSLIKPKSVPEESVQENRSKQGYTGARNPNRRPLAAKERLGIKGREAVGEKGRSRVRQLW